MVFDKRAIQLFKVLANTDDYISSAFVCHELEIRPRTLRDLISKNKSYFLDVAGVKIGSKPNAGYCLCIIDEEKYYKFLKEQIQDEARNQYLVPADQGDRVNYIIRLLLTAEDYMKVDDLADQIFVSRSTLNVDLKQVRKALQKYRIELESKPYYGMRITGAEFDIRACIAKYYFYMGQYDHEYISKYQMNYFKTEMTDEVKSIIYQVISKNDFRLTDFGFKNLTIHLLIALTRIKDVNEVSFVSARTQEIIQTKEYRMAQEIGNLIQQKYHLEMAQNELYFIAVHLLGKKNNETSGNVDESILHLISTILNSILLTFRIDFTKDFDLYAMLLSHLPPMLHRIKYGLKTQNPLVAQIKIDYPLAYELSIHAGKLIQDFLAQEVSEDEIAYLTLHFALSIQKSTESYQKRVIVVCASGRGSSQLLLHKLKLQFPNSFKEIISLQAYQLTEINVDEYDFIISTIDIDTVVNIPVIKIQYFLNDSDLEQIHHVIVDKSNRDFIQQCFSPDRFIPSLTAINKEDALNQMIGLLKQQNKVPENFYEQVMKRELISSTEFGQRVVMPHPLEPITDETFVQVAILEKPIRWDKKMVKFIFLLSVKENSDEALPFFNEVLAKYILNNNLLEILEKNPSFEIMMNSINTIIMSEEGEPASIFK